MVTQRFSLFGCPSCVARGPHHFPYSFVVGWTQEDIDRWYRRLPLVIISRFWNSGYNFQAYALAGPRRGSTFTIPGIISDLRFGSRFVFGVHRAAAVITIMLCAMLLRLDAGGKNVAGDRRRGALARLDHRLSLHHTSNREVFGKKRSEKKLV